MKEALQHISIFTRIKNHDRNLQWLTQKHLAYPQHEHHREPQQTAKLRTADRPSIILTWPEKSPPCTPSTWQVQRKQAHLRSAERPQKTPNFNMTNHRQIPYVTRNRKISAMEKPPQDRHPHRAPQKNWNREHPLISINQHRDFRQKLNIAGTGTLVELKSVKEVTTSTPPTKQVEYPIAHSPEYCRNPNKYPKDHHRYQKQTHNMTRHKDL